MKDIDLGKLKCPGCKQEGAHGWMRVFDHEDQVWYNYCSHDAQRYVLLKCECPTCGTLGSGMVFETDPSTSEKLIESMKWVLSTMPVITDPSELFPADDTSEEDEKVCATCKHFDKERDGQECDIYGIAESIWSCERWEGKE